MRSKRHTGKDTVGVDMRVDEVGVSRLITCRVLRLARADAFKLSTRTHTL